MLCLSKSINRPSLICCFVVLATVVTNTKQTHLTEYAHVLCFLLSIVFLLTSKIAMDYVWYHDYPQIARDSGFKLRQIKDGALDWRLIGTVDIDKLIRDQSFERIDGIVSHIAEAPLGTILDSNVLDSGVAKYFNLAQLSIQYLIFCKKFLDETLTTLRNSLQALQMENFKVKKLYRDSNDELLQLHKKLQRIEDINQVVYPCGLCTKNFISNDMLDTHIKRKHPKAGQLSEKSPAEKDTNLINTIKLELEIKHLKERLNVAEKEIRDNQHTREESCTNDMKVKKNEVNDSVSVATQMHISTRSIGIQSNLEEPKEMDDVVETDANFQQNIIDELREKLSLFEDWRKREALDNERSVDEVKNKVNEMLITLDAKLKQINESKNVPSTNQTEIKDMQKIFSENLVKICSESELKLNNAIRKFEAGYKNKLESLEGLIEKYEIARMPDQKNVETARSLDHPKKVFEQHDTTDEDESETEGSEEEIVPSSPVLSNFIRSETFVLSSDEESERSADPEEREQIRQDNKPSIPIEVAYNGTGATSTPKIIRKVTSKAEPQRQRTTEKMLHETTRKIVQKRFNSFGMNPKMKSLSRDSMLEISKIIAERRSLCKKKTPTYFVTRNQLKHLIEKLAKEKLKNANSSDESFDLPINSAGTKKFKTKPNQSQGSKLPMVVKENVNDIKSANESVENRSASVSKVVDAASISQRPNLDHFKSRLEKILSSPIRKPTPIVIHLAPKAAEPENITSGLKKPVPTPRKKVMFDFSGSSSDNEGEIIGNRKPQKSDSESL